MSRLQDPAGELQKGKGEDDFLPHIKKSLENYDTCAYMCPKCACLCKTMAAFGSDILDTLEI